MQQMTPAEAEKILRLINSSSLGELQRLAIGRGIATMETDAETTVRRMRKLAEECRERASLNSGDGI